MNYIIFLLWGLVFVAPAEFGINFFIIPEASLEKFVGAICVYIVLLSVYYFLRMRSYNEEGNTRKIKIIETAILGSFGLFVMEWLIIGNSPTGNPQALQSSMFIWWIFVFVFPKIMTVKKYKTLRLPLLIFQILYSTVSYMVAFLTQIPLAGVFIYGYGLWGFYIFLYLYIKK